MKLTAKVIKVESADDYGDKIERITIRFKEGGGMYNELRLPNLDGYRLNEEVLVNLAPMTAMQNLNETDKRIAELALKATASQP